MSAETNGWQVLVAPEGTPLYASGWTDVTPFLRSPYPTPQEELRDRLNAGLRGTAPGLPLNWKGLR